MTLVAKSHDRHVLLALRTTLEENLAMIADTISHLREHGQRVFLDAEHFFDGYRSNPAYALEVVKTAVQAGADLVALCDTNGGMMPNELGDTVHAVHEATRHGSASTATTTPHAASPTPWSPWTRASRTSRARPTGTASGPATPTCSAW